MNYTSGWCCVTLFCVSVLGYIRGEITGAVLIYLIQYILTTYLKAINKEAHWPHRSPEKTVSSGISS